MIFDLGKKSRLIGQRDEGSVYIEFIQTAPWSIHQLDNEVIKYKRSGTLLLQKAIQYSKERSWKGRVGLHSLKGAEDFYLKCGFTDLGSDSQYDGLRYFEMTPQQAEQFSS